MLPVTFDLGLVLQGAMVLAIGALVKSVWSAGVAIAALGASFAGYKTLSNERHASILNRLAALEGQRQPHELRSSTTRTYAG
jgi:hypothetical protein